MDGVGDVPEVVWRGVHLDIPTFTDRFQVGRGVLSLSSVEWQRSEKKAHKFLASTSGVLFRLVNRKQWQDPGGGIHRVICYPEELGPQSGQGKQQALMTPNLATFLVLEKVRVAHPQTPSAARIWQITLEVTYAPQLFAEKLRVPQHVWDEVGPDDNTGFGQCTNSAVPPPCDEGSGC